MRILDLFLASLLALGVGAAQAAPPSIPPPAPVPQPFATSVGGIGNAAGDASSLSVLTSIADQVVTLAELNSDQIHTAAFGSICDGQHHYLSGITSFAGQNSAGWTVSQWQAYFPTLPNGATLSTTDIDGLAISAAFAAGVASNKPFTMRVDGQRCYATYSINNSGLTRKNVILDFSNTQITSVAPNVPALDFAGDQFLTIIAPYITGSCTSGSEPYSGMRFARLVFQVEIGNILLVNPRADGCFLHAARENIATEISTTIRALEVNQDTGGSGYDLVEDSINHFNAAATEPYQTITLAVDSANAMTLDLELGGQYATAKGPSPLWISGMQGGKFINSYFNNSATNSSNYGVTLFETSYNPDTDVTFDSYVEGTSLTSVFFVTGSTATPTIKGLHYRMRSDWSIVSTFTTDTGIITAAKLLDSDLWIPVYANGSTPTLFDHASLWTVSGNVTVPAQSNWTFPAAFSGNICIATCTPVAPTTPMNVNSDFIFDAPWEHSATTTSIGNQGVITDGWTNAALGTNGKSNYQSVANNGCGGNYYIERATVTTAYTVGSTDALAARTGITGDVIGALFWNTANALPITVDMWMKSSVTGTFAIDVSNYNATRHWTHNLTITAANTCQEFVFQIPGAPSGFSLTANTPSLRFQVVLDAGSGVQQAPDTWTTTSATQVIGTSSQTHLLATLSATLSFGPVRMFPGYYLPPFAPKTAPLAALENATLYEKSPPLGTGPSANNTYQNVGATGAYTFNARVAGTGSNTQSVWVPFQQKMNGSAGAEPTVTGYSTSANTANCYDATGSADSGALSITNVSNSGFEATCTLGSAVSAGDVIQFNWTAAAAQ